MIHNALTGEVSVQPKTLVQQNSDFTAEGAPPPVNGAPSPVNGTHAQPLSARIASIRPNGVVAIEDWDTMLSAVTGRLRQAAGEPLMQRTNGAAAPIQAVVLECADALDQLHVTLVRALARRAQGVVPDGATDSQEG